MYRLEKVDKKFPGVHALKAIDFEVKKGEIVGLVGENGAGKSTLMKVIYGVYQPDGGQILINGEPVHIQNPRQAMDKGVGMVFQEQSLIPNLTVMENIFLGFESQFVKMGVINWREMGVAARKQLQKVKLDIDPRRSTASLSFAQRQLVELAKVLTLEERVDGDLVILLDEPTSILAREEVELLFELVRDLTSRAGFIFVSHRMDEVMELSDRIYVMKDGEVVDVVTSENANADEVQHKMVGRDIDQEYYREQKQLPYGDEVLLKFDDVSADKYHNLSFELRRGEVLCLVGTEGSGREAVLRSVFGLNTPTSGKIYRADEDVTTCNARNAVSNRIGYIPRERKTEGVVGGMSVFENMTLSQLKNYSHFGVLDIHKEKNLAKKWIDHLGIKTPSVYKDVGGGFRAAISKKWFCLSGDLAVQKYSYSTTQREA